MQNSIKLFTQLFRLSLVIIGIFILTLFIISIAIFRENISTASLVQPTIQSTTAAPVLNIEKTGPISASVGSSVSYGFIVSHAEISDGSPVSDIIVSDDLAGKASYIVGDTNGNEELDGNETWVYSVAYVIQPTDSDPMVNTATVVGKSKDGGEVTSSDTYSTTLSAFAPVLIVQISGPNPVREGEQVFYFFTVRHSENSDGSPVNNIEVNSDIDGSIQRVGGDTNKDNKLDKGEMWIYIVSSLIQPTQLDQVSNTVNVQGETQNKNIVAVSNNYITTITEFICDPDTYDDFNDFGNWPVVDTEELKTEYSGDGEYSVLTKNVETHFVTPSDDRFFNYEIEVDAHWATYDSTGKGYGIVFGLAGDDSQLYLYQINTDRREYRLLRYSNNIWNSLTNAGINSGWVGSNRINDDPLASNRLKVIRSGSRISLYVNDIELETIVDSVIQAGRIGLSVEQYGDDPDFGTQQANARFQNFKLNPCVEPIQD